jgi:hypothetical protein
MLTTTLTALITGCNLFQAPPAEPTVIGLNPASGLSSQAVTGVTPAQPSVTVSFDTSMNRDTTERAIAIHPGEYNPATNPTTVTTLTLTSMCNGRWRVRNPNAVPISFNWDVYNTAQKGVGVAPANSDVFFQTSLGSNTMLLFASGKQQQVKATNPAPGGLLREPAQFRLERGLEERHVHTSHSVDLKQSVHDGGQHEHEE